MNTTYCRRAAELFNSRTLNYRATLQRGVIVVHEDVELGADPLATMAFIAFLRTSVAQDVEVRWSGLVRGTLDTASLHHLWPPTTLAGIPPEQGRAWREAFRYGLCHFRRGPGFVLVKDARVADGPTHFVIDDPDLTAAFLSGCAPLRDRCLTATQREAVDVLAEENLLYRLGDLLLTLPTHMHRWPIPFDSV